MFTRVHQCIAALVLGAGVLTLGTAQAQTVRFISSSGSNANDCTREAPCRTLQRGINRTPAGGELQILDSGFYGNGVIAKSINISAIGVATTLGNLVIDGPDATVALRGLMLSGASLPTNTSGLSILNASAVHIVGCEIERFPGQGILITASNGEVSITNTAVRSNKSHGIIRAASSSLAVIIITNSRFENSVIDGLRLDGPGGRTIVENSVAAGNGKAGLRITNGSVLISNSVVTQNATGLQRVAPGQLLSRRNNTVRGNSNDVIGLITPFNPS